MTYTTIEQSKKLLELGINPNTADMFYIFDTFIHDIGGIGIGKPEEPQDVPCWSFERLIEIMPRYMKSGKNYFDLMIVPFDKCVKYYNESTKSFMESKMGKDLMEAAFKMAERLLKCKSTYLKDNTNKLISNLD